MKKAVFLVCCSVLLCGCIKTYQANPGSYSVTVGEVKAYKSLEYIGQAVPDQLVVKVDDNRNAILLVGDGKIDAMSVVLSDIARQELISHLTKLNEWGTTAQRESVEIRKYLGSISSKSRAFSSIHTSLTFVSINSGKTWVGLMEFCYISYMERTEAQKLSSDPCLKNVKLALYQDDINKLADILREIPTRSAEAIKSKDKSHLFQ